MLPVPESPGPTLRELLGPSVVRPGDLHAPLTQTVPEEFAAAASAARVPVSLAVSVVAERALVSAELAEAGVLPTAVDLDAYAEAATVSRGLGTSRCDYARSLLGLLHGRGAGADGDGTVVVPVRLLDRLAAAVAPFKFETAAIVPALRWELAATLAGRTMTEWALSAALRRYCSPNARQSEAASKTAL
jgi:hypothetical protein